jgi:hypothetical protein
MTMTQDIDDRLGRLLRQGAPPERDPLFRIRLLERRERRRFRQRSLLLLGGGAALVVLPVLVFGLAADPLAAGLVLVFSLAAIAASLVSARGVLQAVRWLRRR